MTLSFPLRGCAIALTLMLAPATAAFAGEDAAVASEVMALARAQWAAGIANKPAADQNASLADDYTEINSDTPTRIDGKSLSTKITAIESSDKTVLADMANPKVQVYGNTAILTYNYIGMIKGTDGKAVQNNAKSTRVYVKQGEKWQLVHAHFTTVN